MTRELDEIEATLAYYIRQARGHRDSAAYELETTEWYEVEIEKLRERRRSIKHMEDHND